jgi:hypothetical protein
MIWRILQDRKNEPEGLKGRNLAEKIILRHPPSMPIRVDKEVAHGNCKPG